MSQSLLVFAKAPHLGSVKTRIAQTLGEHVALNVYETLLRSLADIIHHKNWRSHLWSDTHWPLDHSFPYQFDSFSLQKGADLGQKMLFTFTSHFNQGASRVIIIGADSPDISPEIIQVGFDSLKEKDVVLGPAEDGGYYLIGLSKSIPELFENIAWSTSEVFSSTIRKITAGGYSYALLPMLSDIDTATDWEKYLARQKAFKKD